MCAIAAGLLVVNAAWAVDPFTVRDIRVEGLQRVEPGTIFASLPFRVGETYNDEKGSTAIRALFGLGLFKDVRLEVSGDVLVVIKVFCDNMDGLSGLGEFLSARHAATSGEGEAERT